MRGQPSTPSNKEENGNRWFNRKSINTPQAWLSNIVVAPKLNGDVRICLDARTISKAILHRKFLTPTIASMMINQMSEAKMFSKIDLRKAYTQIQLSEILGR